MIALSDWYFSHFYANLSENEWKGCTALFKSNCYFKWKCFVESHLVISYGLWKKQREIHNFKLYFYDCNCTYNLLENLINGINGWKSASKTNKVHDIPKVCWKSTKNKCQIIRNKYSKVTNEVFVRSAHISSKSGK